MFDDLDKKDAANQGSFNQANSPLTPAANAGAAARNQTGEKSATEDIFSGVDDNIVRNNVPKPDVLKPKENIGANAVFNPNAAVGEDEKEGIKKIMILAGLLIVLAIIGYGGYRGYFYFVAGRGDFFPAEMSGGNAAIGEAQDGGEMPDADADFNSGNPAETAPASTPPADRDDDQDGLLNSEEAALGTDSESSDSDGDGLFDREEAKVYHTNPMNADSDGDSYSDGNEVESGYNPNGSGKLFDFKNEMNNIDSDSAPVE